MTELIKVTGPLDAAIKCLLESIDTIEVNRPELAKISSLSGLELDVLVSSYQTAVRILRAASRIYKVNAIKFIDRMNEDDDARDGNGFMTCPQITIRNLIESLPGGE